MAICILALDLERTLISDAMNREPRPGLYEFLLFCTRRFERVVLFTAVNRATAFDALRECAEQGAVPLEFLEKIEYVEWEGKYKDLGFIRDANIAESVLIDDDGGWIRPDQRDKWIGIAEYDPYLVTGEDAEFARIRQLLEARIDVRKE